ncbi:MAG: dihydropteroate synthase [Candidatus Omnitrophica bacterium]|nr:dihydropteroate synthase [Candidatus Omnitrophota bacterium]
MIRIFQEVKPRELKLLMQQVGVNTYGIRIMAPKAQGFLIKLDSLSNISANILKQEMLSLGADAAVARGSLTGKVKKTDCLLMGSLAQLSRLSQKLKRQPFGLDLLGDDLSQAIKNYQKNDFVLEVGGAKIYLGKRIHIMGILNLTPDSFSGDGVYRTLRCRQVTSEIVDFAQQLVRDGADIIDVGGQSSRPGARPVPLKEELARTIPVIKLLVKKIKVPISIDTSKPEVAKAALDNGAMIVNDITGLRNPLMAKAAARFNAAVVIMHMQGTPRTMQNNPRYDCVVDDIIDYLSLAIKRAIDAGVDGNKIIIDPGVGFGKTLGHNLNILKNLEQLKILGKPILAGVSRKSFIGKILNVSPDQRVFGTVASCILAVKNGAKILRVHDVKAVKQAVKIFDAVNAD